MLLRGGKALEAKKEEDKKKKMPPKKAREEEVEVQASSSPGNAEEENNADAVAVNSPSVPSASVGEDKQTSRFAIRKVVCAKTADSKIITSKEKEEAAIPPSFVVPHIGRSMEQLKVSLFSKLEAGDYVMKTRNNVTQVRPTNNSTSKVIEQVLKNNEFGYYSFPKDGPTFKKFVLYGLNNELITDIITDLKSYGIEAADVKKMKIKKPRYDEHSNYIVYFHSTDKITLQVLMEAKYICRTVVKWAHYVRPAWKVLQCRNCFRYGHTADNCRMKVVCLFCANNHPADECPIQLQKKASGASSVSECLLKCANCQQKHTAVYQFCPARVKLIERAAQGRRNIKNDRPQQFIDAPAPLTNVWNNQNNAIVTDRRRHQPAHNPAHLPDKHHQQRITRSLSPPARGRRHLARNNAEPTQTPTTTKTAADTFIIRKSLIKPKEQKERNVTKSLSNNVHFNSNSLTNNGNIFTPQEMAKIFQEMVGSISKCTSKEEQLNALMGLAIKYLPCRD